MDNEQLVERLEEYLRSGSQQALADVYNAVLPVLMAYALKRGVPYHDAKELAHETMKIFFVLLDAERFSPEGRARVTVFCIAILKLQMLQHRGNMWNEGTLLEALIERGTDIPVAHLMDVDFETLTKILDFERNPAGLTEQEKTLFTHVVLGGLPQIELARQFGVTEPRITQIKQSATAKVRAYISTHF